MTTVICEAIRAQRVLEFDYHGHRRVAEPYCHGSGQTGAEMLRAIQVGGSSQSGGFGFGKLWVVAEMHNVRIGAAFTPNDPHYNPRDSAMRSVHCCVERSS